MTLTGASSPCLVTDTSSGQNFADLPDAVAAAAAGNTLTVEGIRTSTTEIGKNLTLTGSTASATLDGGGQGSVLTIDSGVTATLNTLTITGGGGDIGGGIYNPGGTVNVNGSTITGNTATNLSGGGIYNLCGGILTGAVDGGNVNSNIPDQIFSVC